MYLCRRCGAPLGAPLGPTLIFKRVQKPLAPKARYAIDVDALEKSNVESKERGKLSLGIGTALVIMTYSEKFLGLANFLQDFGQAWRICKLYVVIPTINMPVKLTVSFTIQSPLAKHLRQNHESASTVLPLYTVHGMQL